MSKLIKLDPVAPAVPAFPHIVDIVGPSNDIFTGKDVPQGRTERYIFSGLSVRDYFIAHAPAEPQPWFEPVLPPKESSLPQFGEMYPDRTDAERSALNAFDSDYMRVEDVKEERVRNYLLQREEQVNRLRAYNAMAHRERYVQWPAAWADAILKARTP